MAKPKPIGPYMQLRRLGHMPINGETVEFIAAGNWELFSAQSLQVVDDGKHIGVVRPYSMELTTGENGTQEILCRGVFYREQ